MQGTPKVCKINHVVVGGQQYRQIWIPSYMLRTSHAQDIYTKTFIDCRADINCINYDFTWRNKIPLKKLEKPLLVNNVDGSPNEAGMIKHSVVLFIKMGEIIHKEEFHTIKCGKDNIILGLPWLNQINPSIDWKNKKVDIHKATNQMEEYNMTISQGRFTIRKATEEPSTHPELLPLEHEKEDPIYPDENFVNYIRGTQYVYTKGTNWFEMKNGRLTPLSIAKTSIASKLAQKVKEVQITYQGNTLNMLSYSQKKHLRKCLLAEHMTTQSSSMKPSSQKLAKSTHYPPMNKKPPTTLLKKISEQGKFNPLPLHKHPPLSMLERRTWD